MLAIISFAVLCVTLNSGVDGFARIKYGEETDERFPFLVYLATPAGNNMYRTCGASIIQSKWVLTAAHCVVNTTTGVVSDDTSVIIYAGSNQAFEGTAIKSVRVIPHEKYNPLSGRPTNYDIALIELESPVPSDIGSPVQLPTKPIDLTGQRVLSIGWGITEFGATSTQLRKGYITIVNKRDCKIFNIPDKTGAKSDGGIGKICAAIDFGQGHTATGEGDSGGPILVKDPDNQNNLVQVGLVSYGSILKITLGSASVLKQFDVFTDVSFYLEWINNTVKRN